MNFFRRCGVYTDIEDMAQETFLKLYRVRSTYEAKAKFTTFLYLLAVVIGVTCSKGDLTGLNVVNIAFLAHDKKKELMVQFCTAYKSVLSKHNLFATATTGRLIADNTGLPMTLLLSHKQGGHQ